MDKVTLSYGDTLVVENGFAELKVKRPTLSSDVPESRRAAFDEIISEVDGKRNVSLHIRMDIDSYRCTVSARLADDYILIMMPKLILDQYGIVQEVVDTDGNFVGYESGYYHQIFSMEFAFMVSIDLDTGIPCIDNQIILDVKHCIGEYEIKA